jgi:hypothetical protein
MMECWVWKIGKMGYWGNGVMEKCSESVIQWVSESVGRWAVDSEQKTDDRVESLEKKLHITKILKPGRQRMQSCIYSITLFPSPHHPNTPLTQHSWLEEEEWLDENSLL